MQPYVLRNIKTGKLHAIEKHTVHKFLDNCEVDQYEVELNGVKTYFMFNQKTQKLRINFCFYESWYFVREDDPKLSEFVRSETKEIKKFETSFYPLRSR